MIFDFCPAGAAPRPTPMHPSVRLTRFYRHLFLWVIQGWLAMFYIGAAAAKLTEPLDALTHLLQWPATVDPALVRAIGWGEAVLASAVLSPLMSWRLFRPLLLTGTAVLLGEAVVMGVWHALERHWTLALVNVVLAALATTVLLGRRPVAECLDARA